MLGRASSQLLAGSRQRILPLAMRSVPRYLSSSNVAEPRFSSPPVKTRADEVLVGPMGPLKNMDEKTSTVELSPVFHRHRTVVPFMSSTSKISCEAFVTPNSTVAGNVCIGDRTTVWYGSVVRGDENSVVIGAMTNILEGSVITTDCEHTDLSIDTDGTGGRVVGFPGSVKIGDFVTIEAGSVLRACTIESNVIIGAGSVICEGALVESGAIVAPGTVVPPGRRVPGGQVWSGKPAEYVRDVDHDEETLPEKTAQKYYARSLDHHDAVYPLESYSLLSQHAQQALQNNQ